MAKRLSASRAGFFAGLCVLAQTLMAGPLQRTEVPEPLQPWIDWVLFDDKHHACPFFYNNFKSKRCAWPGELRLDLNDEGGVFSSNWRVFADSWVILPGERKHWPVGVEVNDEVRAVIERGGRPSLHLGPGRYTISGAFTWPKLPQSLAVPADTAIVNLILRGDAIQFPDIDAQGQIWLGRSRARAAGEGAEANTEAVTVLRRIVDGIPLQVHTRIELDVTGEQRELVLGRPLLEGFIPVTITSPMPTRIEPNGELRVQLRAGRHVIEIHARHPQQLAALTLPEQTPPWPADEVWAFEARNDLRVVEIEGVVAVDPRQTRAPQEWHRFPVYTLNAGDSMRFTVVRRGDPEPEPDKLTLARQLWLDFDGGGYSVEDRIGGTITRNWRLDSSTGLELGQVVVDGKPRFITRLGSAGADGVEVRRGRVNLVADARMVRHGGAFAATGWAHDFQNVEATLNLPPGWDVLAIDGVDNVPRTWIARWTLLDLFLVLVIAAAVTHLWDWRAGTAALLMLVLIWHAPDAPRYIWLSLFIAVALLRVLPAGRARSMVSGFRSLTVLALIIICIPFVVNELRLAVYPQLAAPHQRMGAQPRAAAGPQSPAADDAGVVSGEIAGEADLVMTDEMVDAPAMAVRESHALKASRTGKRISRPSPTRGFAVDPSAVVQTGPGLPEWRWKSLQLSWNGPVDRSQTLSIIYLGPLTNTLMHVLRVVLLGVLLALVFGGAGRRALSAARNTVGFLVASAALSGAAPIADAAAASFPDQAMLESLRQRLSAPPDCAKRCADITSMRLEVEAATLQIRLETHSSEANAIPLPGRAGQWTPQTILVDGSAADATARDPAGTLWLLLPEGVHQVYLKGALPERTRVQLQLPLRPHIAEISVSGWAVEGLRDDGQVEAQLQFTRQRPREDDSTPAAFETNQLPSFIRVERTLRLGLDWSMTTRVARAAAGTTAAVIAVPLVAGESVVTPGMEVNDGAVKVNLAADVNALIWNSVIEKGAALRLTAPQTTAWLETWRLQIGPMWHAEIDGIAPVHHQDATAEWLPLWRPWPGETVTINVVKPDGVPGQTLTIDRSSVTVQPGKRATDTSLSLRLRSSKGGQYTMRLPQDATLQTVRIDGAAAPLRAQGRDLTIPVTPGTQTVELEWRKAEGIAFVFDSAAIDLAIESTNHQIEMILGEDRWPLLTFGPSLGPAVLFWSLFGALLIVAVGLARVPLTPLTTTQWLLLAIGLSQVDISLAAVVVLWLFALGLRERYGGGLGAVRFNLAQIGLVLLTLAALVILIEAIRHGLLGRPDMHVAGNGSDAQLLRWYTDRVAAQPPTASVISAPIVVYRLLMLAWALWLAFAILKWLRWAWTCFAVDGLWRPWRKPKQAPS